MKSLNPRTAVIPPIRVTAAELARVKALAAKAKLTTADYVRSRCLPGLTK